MPKVYSYNGGDIAIDVHHLEFNYNFESEELRNAILRFKQTVFSRRYSDVPAEGIREVNIVMKKEFVEFVVVSSSSSSLDFQGWIILHGSEAQQLRCWNRGR